MAEEKGIHGFSGAGTLSYLDGYRWMEVRMNRILATDGINAGCLKSVLEGHEEPFGTRQDFCGFLGKGKKQEEICWI